jgi:hypothetical protein
MTLAITTADRGELVDLKHSDTQKYVADAFNWLRDLTAKGARAGADSMDEWAKQLDQLEFTAGGLKDYLREQDNWVANLFGEVLALIELLNPLTVGKQVAIWILEDFRDLLRAIATLIDTQEETSEETQDALAELALAAAALAVPYVGRAGKIVARVFKGLNNIEEGLAMLRHLGRGDVLKYLRNLDLPKYAGKVMELLGKIIGKVGDALGRWLPKVKKVLAEWTAKLAGWIKSVLGKIQAWLNQAIAAIQKKIYEVASNLTNNRIVDKLPDQLLDWVAGQINGNLCESCVDNYFVNYMEYERLFPAPNAAQRDRSSFFGPDQGIDGVFEKPATSLKTPGFQAHYSGIPNSLGHVLDELNIEIKGEDIPKAITRQIKPFGNIPADFNPTTKKPPAYPRFVVMEAKFGYHAKRGEKLRNDEWEGKLGTTASGQRQMGAKWIETRLDTVFPLGTDGTAHPKRREITRARYARWLYGCQPHKASNSKQAQARGGKRVVGLAFFPPYALRGFDIDAMGWKI